MKKALQSIVLLLGALMLPAAAYAQQTLYGDVSGDGEVNITDINAIIDVILSDVSNPSADVNNDNEINIADINAVINIILGGSASTHGHEYVDLGLPSGTLWATCNVGASSPEDYGDYFAWGETEPKDNYDWSTYKWCDGSESTLTKYCNISSFGMVDNKTDLLPEDDAAYVNWGPEWRMPTEEQQDELHRRCNWTWTMQNGVDGRLVTGPNGNSIFLPAAGSYWDSTFHEVGSGIYWSRTLNTFDANFSCAQSFDSRHLYWSHCIRVNGYTVRAVRMMSTEDDSQRLYIVQQSLDLGDLPIEETHTGELTIVNYTMEDQSITITADGPFMLKQEESCASSITVVAPSNCYSTVTVAFIATTTGEFNGNITFENPAFNGGQRVVPVRVGVYTGEFPQYVDLGLPSGTLWATRNIGASCSEEYGDRFAWGETEPKDYYSWSNYKWCNGSENTLTKYCTDSQCGYVDGKTELDPEDDAAYVNWGTKWRMPTHEQQMELVDECSWTWTTRNGVDGRLVTGPNGNTLFLPFERSSGYYWSRTLNSDFPSCARGLQLDSKYVGWFYGSRCAEHAVRAVRVPQN